MEVALEMPQSWGAALSFLPFATWLWSRGRAKHGQGAASAGDTVAI